MTIKPEAITAFFGKRQEQAVLAAALDEAFDVTYGNYVFGQAMWLCDPKPLTAERFGLTKEVIALYSPHHTADARLLTALENISRLPEFRHRVDKVVALIIYEGDDEYIEELSRDNNDWVLVPISSRELKKGASPFLIRSKIASKVGQFDLFGMSSPIKHDKYFYGRDPIVQELLQRSYIKKEHSGLFGLRKTGKTSVLFALQRRLADKDAVAEYIDCQSPGVYGSRWWVLLQELALRLTKSTPGISVSNAQFSPDEAANTFVRTVKQIKETTTKSQVVLLLDEIEFITPGISNNLGKHWDIDHLPFWQTIRAASQETGGFISFVVAGVNPSSVEQPYFEEAPNPIFQLAVPFYLEPLNQEGVREMVRAIGKYSGSHSRNPASSNCGTRMVDTPI